MTGMGRRAARPEVTAGDIYTLAKSEFTLWAEHHAPRQARDPVDPLTELLLGRGREHEDEVSDARWPGLKIVPFPTPRESFTWARSRMAEGVPALRRVHLLVPSERLRGQPDLLERDDSHRSSFGRHHYVVREVKLARHIRNHHIAQALFYNHLVGVVQGYTPPHVYMINGDGQEEAFPHDPERLRDLVRRARAVIADEECPRPFWNGSEWPWRNYTNRRAAAARDVSQVTDVGGKRAQLLATLGVRTVRELAEAPVADLVRLPGVGDASARKWRDAARALDSGEPVRRGTLALPAAPTIVFFDLEGTAESVAHADELPKTTYLFGCLLRAPGSARDQYVRFLARAPAEEGEAFLDFCRWFDGLGGALLVHWAPYEKTELTRLFERVPPAQRHRERVMGALRDLHRVLTDAWTLPTRGHGLKEVARWLRFAWRHKDVDAGTSIVYYLRYVEDPQANGGLLDRVVDYNEDDVRATAVAYDWLAADTGRRPPPKRRPSPASRRRKRR
ncbi:MAG TPA: TM0106 family RecB-like putative nuclease [Candidatus Thermoplasmatota archaeon]